MKQIILYILSFTYSYRYEINPARMMYAANSSIQHSTEKLAIYWGGGGAGGHLTFNT